jgi:hypothetical protein
MVSIATASLCYIARRPSRFAALSMRNTLRITVSAGFIAVCIGLIALWVRSYYAIDDVVLPSWSSKFNYIGTFEGHFGAASIFPIIVKHSAKRFDGFQRQQPEQPKSFLQLTNFSASSKDRSESHGFLGLRLSVFRNGWIFVVPYWMSVLLAGIVATIPLLQLRFSLRALFAATTFAAIALGGIICFVR